MFSRVFNTYTKGWKIAYTPADIGKDLSRTVFLGLSVGCFVKAIFSMIEGAEDRKDQALRKERLAMVNYVLKKASL